MEKIPYFDSRRCRLCRRVVRRRCHRPNRLPGSWWRRLDEQGFGPGIEACHFAPSGLVCDRGWRSQGVALGYPIKALWGGAISIVRDQHGRVIFD